MYVLCDEMFTFVTGSIGWHICRQKLKKFKHPIAASRFQYVLDVTEDVERPATKDILLVYFSVLKICFGSCWISAAQMPETPQLTKADLA